MVQIPSQPDNDNSPNANTFVSLLYLASDHHNEWRCKSVTIDLTWSPVCIRRGNDVTAFLRRSLFLVLLICDSSYFLTSFSSPMFAATARARTTRARTFLRAPLLHRVSDALRADFHAWDRRRPRDTIVFPSQISASVRLPPCSSQVVSDTPCKTANCTPCFVSLNTTYSSSFHRRLGLWWPNLLCRHTL